MKVFLGNPPWFRNDLRGIRAGSRWPHMVYDNSPYKPFPFYLGYAAALLKKNGFTVELVDALAEEVHEEEYFKRMRAFAPDLVFHEVATASFKKDLELGERVKHDVPGAKLALGGAHAAMYKLEFLRNTPYVDFALRGEYEFTLLELAKTLEVGGDLAAVNGLNFKRDGESAANPDRPLTPLSAFPWPARELLPMAEYCDNPMELPMPTLQIHTSRGCPFTCSFCAWPQIMYGGNKYRWRDAADVVDEIEWCKKEYGYRSFYIDDDTFNIGKKKILDLCDELIRRKVNLPWSVMARADTADDETLERMKQAGLVSIKYGVESGDQEILDRIGKKLDLQKAQETVRKTRELGVKFHLTFLFGLPGETKETARKTVELARALDPDSIQFSIVTPFPGSRLHGEMQESGLLVSEDFDDYDGNHRAVIRTEALSPEELEEILRTANAGWHRRTFLRRFWANRGFYIREIAKHPLRYLKMFHETVINPR